MTDGAVMATDTPVYRIAFRALGGPAEVQLAAPSPAAAKAWAQLAIDEIERIEAKFSRYREGSLLCRINAAAGGAPVATDEETEQLLDVAQALHEHSGGRFDITSGVLRGAWDFRSGRLPSPSDVETLLPQVGWPRVERSTIDGIASVRLPRPGMEIDFGGFGKEYAADRAATALAEAGVVHGLVSLAGDLHALGPKPNGSPWMIGIQHPRDRTRMLAEVPLQRGGLATSGDYERYLEVDGRRYCHVLNALSGWPVQHWASVSVLAPTTLAAGCLSTLCLLTEGDGLQLLRDSGLDFLAMTVAGEVHTRAG
jgi:FAD:protein FMN transferase